MDLSFNMERLYDIKKGLRGESLAYGAEKGLFSSHMLKKYVNKAKEKLLCF